VPSCTKLDGRGHFSDGFIWSRVFRYRLSPGISGYILVHFRPETQLTRSLETSGTTNPAVQRHIPGLHLCVNFDARTVNILKRSIQLVTKKCICEDDDILTIYEK
jgi:hypothetical protein